MRALVAGLVVLAIAPAATAAAAPKGDRGPVPAHIVVIYQENHSFDNLFGRWERVDGLADAPPARRTQVSQSGAPYACLLQNDVNLTSPSPLATTCTDDAATPPFQSAFRNGPFSIDNFIAPTDTTCPAPGAAAPQGVPNGTGLPGGCTRDLVHAFYQEQYQLDGGRQDRYVTGSNAVGMAMGIYRTRSLPLYRYFHRRGHPPFAIADAFFQAAFGGSFLNHQWLIAAATPTFPSPPAALRTQVDSNGMPAKYPLYTPTGPVTDAAVAATCDQVAAVGRPDLGCGDYAVNTLQPAYQPYAPGTNPANLLPPQTAPTIGDRLSAKRIEWAWYAGGWSNADGAVGRPGWTNGTGPVTVGTNLQACPDPAARADATWPNCPDALFQFHHQPFDYFAQYAPGTRARADHLRDETEFLRLARSSAKRCRLRPVSFVKPIGEENEHPGYASAATGSDHAVDLLKAVEGGKCAASTMVILTYDEFGGAWDHVAPPGQGGTRGPHDVWGPGSRVPALVVSPGLRGDFVVDHVQHDTTSIPATIEDRFGLRPLSTRDARVKGLASVYAAPPATRQRRHT